MRSKEDILQQYFGYSEFRKGQNEIMSSILNGRDTVGIMPTGAGKSLCFQVPTLAMEGITLVVSPLISLMKDQVSALVQNGVRAAYLNSSLSAKQYQMALKNACDGVYKIIYIAPERLQTEEFLQFAFNANISMVTIDEAHCVSQWGQDFRPGYLQVSHFIKSLPKRPVVSAFSATATPKVKDDIINLLELKDPYVYLGGFDRENLYFEVQKPKDKTAALLKILSQMKDKSGIIYCTARKKVEEVCQILNANGYSATRYHAGLPDDERRSNQEDFIFDRCGIMVATNAFGMGIDKSNVSFVIHYNMPKDLESYYQEAGRAGRDGDPASCFLLYGGQDVITNQFLLDNGEENSTLDEATRAIVQKLARERLTKMTFYCHTKDCLRDYILKYFCDTSTDFCNNCSNCVNTFEEEDITSHVKKVLMCVKNTGEKYGTKLIIDVLRGAKTARIEQLELDKEVTYSIMQGTKRPYLQEIINFMIEKKYLEIYGDEYPIIILGSAAGALLIDQEPVYMKTAKDQKAELDLYKKYMNVGTGSKISAGKETLLASLKKLRTEIATKEKIPSYIVFSNASLEDMCLKMPRTKADFLEVSGVGKQKLESYGDRFLKIINEFNI